MGTGTDAASVADRPPEAAAVAESHTAVVVFIGDRAYKVKKPVDFGFLDFTTVSAREVACRREVALNRRLAADVYLDVSQVVDGSGRACDWLVVMQRMPESRRLSTLVSQGVDVSAELQQIARVLASFHSSAATGSGIDSAGTPAALRARWTDNFAGAEAFVGELLDRDRFDEISRLALDFVDGRATLLHDRVRRGYIVDGHGDLVADDIFCLADGPRMLDCLEFDDALRHVDALDDAAFLAMDLERLGAPGLGQRFLTWYQEFSGAEVATSLGHHYLAYRAFVRAKVACLRHSQGVVQAASDARRLADVTVAHLRAGQVRLVLVGGSPGTGKSTVAGALADRLGAVLLSTDRIRRELPGARGLAAHAGYGRGLYSAEHVHATYCEMLTRARALVERGESVVLDASWSDGEKREQARGIARDTRTSLTELRCAAPAALSAARVAERGDGVSDATADVAEKMAREFAWWPEATEIDTSGRPQAAVTAAWEIIDQPP